MERLLVDARAGLFDILCAEALDRISRDQEDMAHVHKLLRFNGIKLHTAAEGLTHEMHIGLKGTMNALFLEDLADKTRRGLRGRVEQGRSGGGLAYGYDVVAGPDDAAGGRSINEAQAIIVRRIFSPSLRGGHQERLLICGACGADFCPTGRDRYGCASHYRRKTCGNGKILPRRAMEVRIRDLLVEAAIAIAMERHGAVCHVADEL